MCSATSEQMGVASGRATERLKADIFHPGVGLAVVFAGLISARAAKVRIRVVDKLVFHPLDSAQGRSESLRTVNFPQSFQ